jgi:tripartite-type tricarboxylate transporter receptor subunit TctC
MLKRLALACLTVAAPRRLAQDLSHRTVTMIVPYAAGGPTDTVARVLAQAMTKPSGRPSSWRTSPAPAASWRAETVKNAKPDGYTILLHHIGMATTPTLYRTALRFDPLKDFEYIGLVNDVPMTIIGKPGSRRRT